MISGTSHANIGAPWLGIGDFAVDGEFIYESDGKPVELNHFIAGQPNGAGSKHDLVSLDWQSPITENSFQCSNASLFGLLGTTILSHGMMSHVLIYLEHSVNWTLA